MTPSTSRPLHRSLLLVPAIASLAVAGCLDPVPVTTETGTTTETTTDDTNTTGPTTTTTSDPTTTTTTTESTTDDPTTTTLDPTTEDPAVCGDGVVDPGEDCDDMGESATCNADCTTAECGDGKLNASAGETCDDGGDSPECNADCTLAACGDGYLNEAAGEQCEDGNDDPLDGCDDCSLRYSVFVTSITYKGSLGGLETADAHCNSLAMSADLKGEFRAWLSDAENGPATRFGLEGFPGNFTLPNGDIVATGWDGLLSGLVGPLNADESGFEIDADSPVWSNTTVDGEPLGDAHCEGWTNQTFTTKGHLGLVGPLDGNWTDVGETAGCSSNYRFYCFQVATP